MAEEKQTPEAMSGILGYGTSDPSPPEYEMDRDQLNWLQQYVVDFYQDEDVDPGFKSALAALDDWMPGIPFHDIVPDPPTSLPGGRESVQSGRYISADESRAALGAVGFTADVLTGIKAGQAGYKYIKGAYTEAGSMKAMLSNALDQVKDWGYPGRIATPEEAINVTRSYPEYTSRMHYLQRSIISANEAQHPRRAAELRSELTALQREGPEAYEAGAHSIAREVESFEVVDSPEPGYGGSFDELSAIPDPDKAARLESVRVAFHSLSEKDLSKINLNDFEGMPVGTTISGKIERGTMIETAGGDKISGQLQYRGPENVVIQEHGASELTHIPTSDIVSDVRGTKGLGTQITIERHNTGFEVNIGNPMSDLKIQNVGTPITGDGKTIQPAYVGGASLKYRAFYGSDGEIGITGLNLFARDIVNADKILGVPLNQPLSSLSPHKLRRAQEMGVLTEDSAGNIQWNVSGGVESFPAGTDIKIGDKVLKLDGPYEISTSFTTERGKLEQVITFVNEDTGKSYNHMIEPTKDALAASNQTAAWGGRHASTMLDMLPDNAVISERSMTLDSLYLLLNQTVRKSMERVKAGKSPLNIEFRGSTQWSTSAGREYEGKLSRSVWSHKMDKALVLLKTDEGAANKLIVELAADIDAMLKKSIAKGRITSSSAPNVPAGDLFKAGQEGIDYRSFTVSGFKSVVASLFGYNTWDEYRDVLEGEGTIEQEVFDEIQF